MEKKKNNFWLREDLPVIDEYTLLKDLKKDGHILFSDDNGSVENINLNDSITNYESIEITYGELYQNSLNYLRTLKITNNYQNLNLISLDLIAANSNSSGILLFSQRIMISGKNLTRQNALKLTIINSGSTYDESSNIIGIKKIVGYNKK